MPAFKDPLDPVALPGEAVKFEPNNEVRRVEAMEQLARIGPIDYGSATSGSSAQESGDNVIDLGDELDMNDRNLGQFIVNPLSLVEVKIHQTGKQSQRFVNKNQVGVITPFDPVQQRLIWVFESDGINAVITNNQTWDMAKTLIYYIGYKFRLSAPLTEGEVQQLPGRPASIPVDTLKQPGGQ